MKTKLRQSIIELNKWWVLLAIMVIMGGFFRLIALDRIPNVINRDEAAIGYNAYSILHVGQDEYGVRLPFSFRSFGDYKLPGMIYTVAGLEKLIDMNLWSVRLPTALFGFFTLLSLFWLSQEMGWSKKTGLIMVFLLTFSFWHLSQSRLAYEPIAGLFWSVTAWAAWLRGVYKKPIFLLLAAVCYLGGGLFYNVPWLLIPMLFGASLVVDWNSIKKIMNGKFLVLTIILVIGVFGFIGYQARAAIAGKLNVTFVSDPATLAYGERVVHAGLLSGYPSRLVRLIQGNLVNRLYSIARGYVAAFDPGAIYFDGDNNNWHTLAPIGLGNINPVELLALILGFYYLSRNISQKKAKLVLIYFLVAPVVSATTITDPVLNRLVDFHLALTMIAALGVAQVMMWVRQSRQSRQILLGCILVFVLWLAMTLIFLFRYFYTFNYLLSAWWYPGLDQVASLIKSQDQSQNIFVLPDLELGYIYLAFYQKIDPAIFRITSRREMVGFDHVVSVANYRFFNSFDIDQLTPQNINNYFYDDIKNVVLIKKNALSKDVVPDQIITSFRGDKLWYIKSYSLDYIVDYLQRKELGQSKPSDDNLNLLINYLQSCQKSSCNALILKDIENSQ